MGIRNFFKRQLASVIEWRDPDGELLLEKYDAASDEIKDASKLIVAPGQGCALVYQGRLSDVLLEEGIYDLETANHPFITSLLKIRQQFTSEHKLALYFFRTTEITNQGWGTASAVKYLDPTYNIPVQLSAHGNFSYAIDDVSYLLRQILGVRDDYSLDEAKALILSRIMQTISALLAGGEFGFLQIDHNVPVFAGTLNERLRDALSALGLRLTDFQILATRFDDDTYARIARVADVSADVLAAKEAGLDYSELEKLRALRDAAKNPGGLAGAGVQFGVGAELAKSLGAAAPGKAEEKGLVEQLTELKLLERQGIITADEFEARKRALLGNLNL